MTDSTDTLDPHIETTADIVAAYVSRNSVPTAELSKLIRNVHETLSGLGTAAAAEAPAPKREPAVSIRKSVTEDYIISLEDGRKFKSMKRYLAGLGMTPAEYRSKWGLPADYPIVAPAYARARSVLAKEMQLGRKRVEMIDELKSAAQPEHGAAPAEGPKKRGRAKKAA